MRDQLASALVVSLERDELLRALASAIEGLLRQGAAVPDLAVLVAPQLRQLVAAWDR